MAARSAPLRSKSGKESMSNLEYGCRACLKKSFASRTSTISPAYIKATRCAMSLTTAKSCVMRSIDMPRCACKSFSNFNTCACRVTSKAVVGSSAINKSGSLTKAMAIITRCNCPPDNSNGYCSNRRSGSLKPTRSSHSIQRALEAEPFKTSWRMSASCICAPMRITGFKLLAGS